MSDMAEYYAIAVPLALIVGAVGAVLSRYFF
jgi:hypothetical protein